MIEKKERRMLLKTPQKTEYKLIQELGILVQHLNELNSELKHCSRVISLLHGIAKIDETVYSLKYDYLGERNSICAHLLLQVLEIIEILKKESYSSEAVDNIINFVNTNASKL